MADLLSGRRQRQHGETGEVLGALVRELPHPEYGLAQEIILLLIETRKRET